MQGEGPEADAARNKKFKLIPRIVRGSWIVKQSVGTTPVLLGQKLVTRYFRGPNYFEVRCAVCGWAPRRGAVAHMIVSDCPPLPYDHPLSTPCNPSHPRPHPHPHTFTLQVDVDITSNTVATSVTSLVVGAITSLVVDLAPLVEGQVGGWVGRKKGGGGAVCLCVQEVQASLLPFRRALITQSY